MDTDKFLGATKRRISDREHRGGQTRVIEASHAYSASVESLWEALTNSKQIPEWFLPISGNLRLGGRFQLEGNAGGKILACEPRVRFEVTWEFMDDKSWVLIELTPTSTGTELKLEHISPIAEEMWEFYGPGAVGIGWDMAMLSLAQYLVSGKARSPEEGAAWMASAEGKNLMRLSSHAWGQASTAFGTPESVATSAAERTAAMYTEGIGRGDRS